MIALSLSLSLSLSGCRLRKTSQLREALGKKQFCTIFLANKKIGESGPAPALRHWTSSAKVSVYFHIIIFFKMAYK